MKRTNLIACFALACLTACTPKITNDKSIGEVEAATYKYLADSLLKDFKRQFGGTMYESEKITPIEIDGVIRIGIPEGSAYLFKKDNNKFIKGDLNNDKKMDLIICADMTEGRGQITTKKYFVFLQTNNAYKCISELKADDMVFGNCRGIDLKVGKFNLDSIAGGLLVGNSDYQGNHESFYLNYSYCCATEKYSLDVNTKELKLIFQSELQKKNEKTGVYEQSDIKMPEIK